MKMGGVQQPPPPRGLRYQPEALLAPRVPPAAPWERDSQRDTLEIATGACRGTARQRVIWGRGRFLLAPLSAAARAPPPPPLPQAQRPSEGRASPGSNDKPCNACPRRSARVNKQECCRELNGRLPYTYICQPSCATVRTNAPTPELALLFDVYPYLNLKQCTIAPLTAAPFAPAPLLRLREESCVPLGDPDGGRR